MRRLTGTHTMTTRASLRASMESTPAAPPSPASTTITIRKHIMGASNIPSMVILVGIFLTSYGYIVSTWFGASFWWMPVFYLLGMTFGALSFGCLINTLSKWAFLKNLSLKSFFRFGWLLYMAPRCPPKLDRWNLSQTYATSRGGFPSKKILRRWTYKF